MAGLWEWVGKQIRLTDGRFWATYYGGRNSTGKPVTRDTALTVAAAWACVRIISQTVGVLPYFLYRRLADGSRVPATEHPLYSMLHDQPNEDFMASEFWESVAGCICLEGNAYALRLEFSGRLVGLELLDPRQGFMDVTRLPSGKLRYRFNWRGKSYDVGPEKVVHWRGFGMGGDKGLSPISYGANTIGIAMAADDVAGATFKNGNNSSGFIQTGDRVMKPDQRKDFTKSLKEFQGDENAGKLMLLEGGFEFKAFGINPNEMQMLQARGFSVEQVCSFFGVPPFMVGHQEKSTSWGTGLEQTVLSFLTFCLLTYLKKIQKRNDVALLSPGDRAKGYYTEFAIEGLLQADSAARAAFYSVMTTNGMYTRDEVRVKENMPKRGGNADVLTVQSALVPLDMLGQAPAASDPNALKNALRGFLELEGAKTAAIGGASGQ
jgi:HK97 family phage portal protein